MNFSISKVCLEASFFERECAPKITLKNWTFSCLEKAKRIEGSERVPNTPVGSRNGGEHPGTRTISKVTLFGLGGVTEVLVDPSMKGQYQGPKALLSDSPHLNFLVLQMNIRTFTLLRGKGVKF